MIAPPIIFAVVIVSGCLALSTASPAPKLKSFSDISQIAIRQISLDHLEEREGQLFVPGERKPFTGVATEAKDEPKKRYSYLNGREHGLQMAWHSNGNLAREYFVWLTKKHGLYRAWYLDGKISMEHFYRDGELAGPCRDWHPNGELFTVGTGEGDQAAGFRFWFSENGFLKSTAFFLGAQYGLGVKWDAKMREESRQYFLNGEEKKSVPESSWLQHQFGDAEHKNLLEWNDLTMLNGKLILKNKKEAFSGFVKLVDRGGTIEYRRYSEGIQDGTQRTWYPDGARHSVYSTKNGKLHGFYIAWHRNGNVAEEKQFVDGVLSGFTRSWHPNGIVSASASYLNDIPNGVFIAIHENGRPKECGSYRLGFKDGLWILWNNAGKVERTRYFSAGQKKEVSEENWRKEQIELAENRS